MQLCNFASVPCRCSIQRSRFGCRLHILVCRTQGYLSVYISRGSSIQIRTNGTTEMDELAVGREFADFKSLSATVAQFENSNFVQF